MKCDAFPEGVPARFRFGEDGHVDPVEGDHGIQFELAADLPEPSRRVALRLVAAYRKRHLQQPSSSNTPAETGLIDNSAPASPPVLQEGEL
jgi:hypothetical protein